MVQVARTQKVDSELASGKSLAGFPGVENMFFFSMACFSASITPIRPKYQRKPILTAKVYVSYRWLLQT